MSEKKSRVNVHSVLTVVPGKPVQPGKTRQLSALDHALGLHSLHVIFYYEENPFKSFDYDPVKVCLSEILALYPPATGRLTPEENGNWFVKCNDAGVRTLRANVNVGIDEWLRSADGSEERDLTVWEDMPEDPSRWSPFRIQINEFRGGGAAIGISCSHMIADLTSLTLLFQSWPELHRRGAVSHPPSFLSPPYGSSVPNTNTKSATYYATKSTTQAPSQKMVTATFRFSGSVIKQRLAEIHDSCPDATPFDFLAALFWTRIACLKGSKQGDDNGRHSLTICVDFRRLLGEPLPFSYFGNALHFSELVMNQDEMGCAGLEHTTGLVHHHVSSLKEEEILSGLDWLESQTGEGGRFVGRYAPPFRMYGPELTCVSLEHMIIDDQPVMYSAIFKDNIKPLHVAYHVGNVDGEGLILVTPSPEGELGRTVMVTLPEREITELHQDQAILRLEPTMLLAG